MANKPLRWINGCLGAVLMMSVLERPRAASRETLHLDVFIGAADSWDATSTLIYGESEAILVDCQFRIKKSANRPDSASVVAAMEKFLDHFESARKAASGAGELVAVMKAKYRDRS